jgi:hypothetical protein
MPAVCVLSCCTCELELLWQHGQVGLYSGTHSVSYRVSYHDCRGTATHWSPFLTGSIELLRTTVLRVYISSFHLHALTAISALTTGSELAAVSTAQSSCWAKTAL